MRRQDQSARIAQHLCEGSREKLAGGAPLTGPHMIAELATRFPTASVEEVDRGLDLALVLLKADQAEASLDHEASA